MFKTIRQTFEVTRIYLRSLSGRSGLTLATMLCVALAVATLVGLGALNQGLVNAIERSGDADTVLVMRGGTQAEVNSNITREQVELLARSIDHARFSPEVNLIVDGYRKQGDERANISLRGLTAQGIELRRAALTAGRWPGEGLAELVVGANIARDYQGMKIGDQVILGATIWKVVGEFASDGRLWESEIWGDLAAVQSLFDRPNLYQSVRILPSDRNSGLSRLQQSSNSNPRLQLSVISEADYYRAQAAKTTELAQLLAWPLALLMAVGAVVGALNTMSSMVVARSVEISTLRLIGFSRTAIFCGLVLECVLICVIAGFLGLCVSYAFLDGLFASTLGGGITRIGYVLEFTTTGTWQGMGLAALIGLLGSTSPAISACLQPISARVD
ncbi:MAG: ABC transporter permease [Pseudomonadota bacterium]